VRVVSTSTDCEPTPSRRYASCSFSDKPEDLYAWIFPFLFSLPSLWPLQCTIPTSTSSAGRRPCRSSRIPIPVVKDGGLSFSEFSTVSPHYFRLGAMHPSPSRRWAASGGTFRRERFHGRAGGIDVSCRIHQYSLQSRPEPADREDRHVDGRIGTSVLFSTSLFDLQGAWFGQGFTSTPVLHGVPGWDAVVLGLAGRTSTRILHSPQGQSKFNPGMNSPPAGGSISVRARRYPFRRISSSHRTPPISLAERTFSRRKFILDQLPVQAVFSRNDYWASSGIGRYRRQIAARRARYEKDRLEPGRVDVKVLYLHPIGTQSSWGFRRRRVCSNRLLPPFGGEGVGAG